MNSPLAPRPYSSFRSHRAGRASPLAVLGAVILLALGVDREIVVDDYALSDKFVDYEAAIMRANKNSGLVDDEANNSLMKVTAAIRAPLLASDPVYLQATLQQLDTDYGSPAGFLDKKLGVNSAALDKLRDQYLESPPG